MFYKFLATVMAFFIVSCATNTNALSERDKSRLDLRSDEYDCRKRGIDYLIKCGKSEGLDFDDTSLLFHLIKTDPDYRLQLRAIACLKYANHPDAVRAFYIEELSRQSKGDMKNMTMDGVLTYVCIAIKLSQFRDKEAIEVVEEWLSFFQGFGELLDGQIVSVKKHVDVVKIKGSSPVLSQNPSGRKTVTGYPKGAVKKGGAMSGTVSVKSKTSVLGHAGKNAVSTMEIPDLGIVLLPIEPGSFMMGSTSEGADEKPVHKVTLTEGFWMGRTEVTQAQWRAIMGVNPNRFAGDDRPVETVAWKECVEFCRKLTARERAAGRLSDNLEYRLPTEAEWEYCARGGAKSKGYKYSGSDTLDDVAWYCENSGDQRLNEENWFKYYFNNCRTHSVARKQPNELGLYDMTGNVAEWCGDWRGAYPSKAQVNPT